MAKKEGVPYQYEVNDASRILSTVGPLVGEVKQEKRQIKRFLIGLAILRSFESVIYSYKGIPQKNSFIQTLINDYEKQYHNPLPIIRAKAMNIVRSAERYGVK